MLLIGDAATRLKEIPTGSVHCCVTSPPYWGLRDYGVKGQLGLEKTPEEFLEKMVDVFRGVHRTLRSDGTLWLNMGDSYVSSGGTGAQGKHGVRAKRSHTQRSLLGNTALNGLKSKDMVGMPWLLAFALRADGWYLRQEIIWHKPNPMPESITDRCTKAHEHIFLLSKSQKYFFDAEAIKEKCSPNTHARMARASAEDAESHRAHGGDARGGRSMGPRLAGVNPKAGKFPSGPARGAGAHDPREHSKPDGSHPKVKPRQNESFSAAVVDLVDYRNKRSVWTVGSQPFSEAHFATFPPALIEPCILAGSPPGGVSPWRGRARSLHGRRHHGPSGDSATAQMDRHRAQPRVRRDHRAPAQRSSDQSLPSGGDLT